MLPAEAAAAAAAGGRQPSACSPDHSNCLTAFNAVLHGGVCSVVSLPAPLVRVAPLAPLPPWLLPLFARAGLTAAATPKAWHRANCSSIRLKVPHIHRCTH